MICREKVADEMTFEINLMFCVLVVLTGSSQTEGKVSSHVFVFDVDRLKISLSCARY